MNTEHLLALSVFQVKVWVEVDQNPLVRSWSCNHPCAFLRRVVRHRITGWSEVIRTSDSDIVPTFVWKKRKENFHSCCKSGHQYTPCCVLDDCPQYGTSWTRFIRKILLINQLLNPSLTCWFTNQQCTSIYNTVNTLSTYSDKKMKTVLTWFSMVQMHACSLWHCLKWFIFEHLIQYHYCIQFDIRMTMPFLSKLSVKQRKTPLVISDPFLSTK